MAISTVEVRSHGIQLTGQEKASITPSRSVESTSAGSRVTRAPHDTSGAFSVSGVALTQGQQQATSVQIAAQTLQQVGSQLTAMKRELGGLLRNPDNSSDNQVKEALRYSKARIEKALDNARFDGKRVLDNELKLKFGGTDVRRFSIPGLNVNRLSETPETLRLDFPEAGSVMIMFDGESEGSKTVKMLDRSLIDVGMRADLADDGTIRFQAPEAVFKLMGNRVMVTGQGHRFPAGQANELSLKAEPDGIAELHFDLSSRDGIKHGIAKVNQHLHQVQSSLEQARNVQAELSEQPASFNTQPLSAQEVQQHLQRFKDLGNDFTSTYRALNAQANVRRHTVSALLK